MCRNSQVESVTHRDRAIMGMMVTEGNIQLNMASKLGGGGAAAAAAMFHNSGVLLLAETKISFCEEKSLCTDLTLS
jgi:hypothetical protein